MKIYNAIRSITEEFKDGVLFLADKIDKKQSSMFYARKIWNHIKQIGIN